MSSSSLLLPSLFWFNFRNENLELSFFICSVLLYIRFKICVAYILEKLKLAFSNCKFEMSRESIPNHSKIKIMKLRMAGVLVNINKIRKSVDFD